jgi:hypothetical protein
MTAIVDETVPLPSEAVLQQLLRRYRRLATAEARVHNQVRRHEVIDDRERTIAAADLVAQRETNPLTGKEHSWTSAKEYVGHLSAATAREDALLELRYRADLLEIERRLAWATLEALVRASYHAHD